MQNTKHLGNGEEEEEGGKGEITIARVKDGDEEGRAKSKYGTVAGESLAGKARKERKEKQDEEGI